MFQSNMRVPSPVQNLAYECSAFPEKSGVSFRFVSADVAGYMLEQN
jgi:hypothetical protein